jgi:hypothetical protein
MRWLFLSHCLNYRFTEVRRWRQTFVAYLKRSVEQRMIFVGAQSGRFRLVVVFNHPIWIQDQRIACRTGWPAATVSAQGPFACSLGSGKSR